MSTDRYIKPSSALLRADELLEVGQERDALAVLHSSVLSPKFKLTGVGPDTDTLCRRHGELAMKLRDSSKVREMVVKMKNIAIPSGNSQLLCHMVQHVLDYGESLLEAAKAEGSALDVADDLDESASPETVLLNAVATTRRSAQKSGAHAEQFVSSQVASRMKTLYEVLKSLLDMSKNHGQLLALYTTVASFAFRFCEENSRAYEFRRLADVLRLHFAHARSRVNRKSYELDTDDADVVQNILDLRLLQLATACRMKCWREAYESADDVHEVCKLLETLSGRKPRVGTLAQYYRALGDIFWAAGSLEYHAFACVKLYLVAVAAKAPDSELEVIASRAVLALLSVPDEAGGPQQVSQEVRERRRKVADLFNVSSVPSRQRLAGDLEERKIVATAHASVGALWALVNAPVVPSDLCAAASALLSEIQGSFEEDAALARDETAAGETAREAEDRGSVARASLQYLPCVRSTVVRVLMGHLSRVYCRMSLTAVCDKVAALVSADEVERLLVRGAGAGGSAVTVNHIEDSVSFSGAHSQHEPLSELLTGLHTALALHDPEWSNSGSARGMKKMYHRLERRVERERSRAKERVERIEARLEEVERIKAEAAEESLRAQAERERREKQREKELHEERTKRRQQEKENEVRERKELDKAREHVEEIKKKLGTRAEKILVNGKKITDLVTIEDFASVGAEAIARAGQEHLDKEKEMKIKVRRADAKKVEHLTRALREAEMPKIRAMQATLPAEDEEYYNKLEEMQEAIFESTRLRVDRSRALVEAWMAQHR